MSKIAIYAGSFDPVTNGHLDIVQRALKIFDKVIIAVGENKEKKYLFSVQERAEMIKECTKKFNVEVEYFSGLLVDFARKKKANALVRGLRAVSDFDFEFQTALMNRKLCPEIETVCIMTRGMYSYLSASIVREVASLNGNLSDMVPDSVAQKLRDKFHKT
ncbi:MAG TPA: pantetheine-phosphate adenylyltransferase [Candidatus Nanoarchaeia archaeon]|nr:pantetheine-phosphate adenylyltransferase [Candidatus Nanoarchaeia archaeon]